MAATNISESIPFYDVFGYYEWTLTLADPRTKGWPMVDSVVPTLTCVCIYLFLVWIGPRIMRDRKPFDLTSFLIPYNLAMALLNLYICLQLFVGSTMRRYSYICEPCRQSFDPAELRIVDAVWWYYFSKVLEFSDTFFFILRKKDNQLTFLHVYHHSTMFSFWWIGIKWVPSGSTFLPAMVNSFIHVLMYAYYGLSAVGPHMNKYLWWKKYLTILQLIQFTVAMILGINGIVTGCEFPLWMHYTLIGYMISFIVLFGNFYAQAYLQGKPIRQFEINCINMGAIKEPKEKCN
ncbi:elongation of very long chain fatty acids protein 4-like [Anopheles cruzii]|uniref:elongation of very long chain fatty acids protein 4-like n=1 Tax=Anopheles cruzii TaxID=68878 RepID=UPI0022EC529F|nr:elongation of very long chain fatty acids protein 4-like [Anopheles cruzii]